MHLIWSYLPYGTFRVSIHGIRSWVNFITSGVPVGPVLGLFCSVETIPECIPKSSYPSSLMPQCSIIVLVSREGEHNDATSVSYTHLDVYKRQIQSIKIILQMPNAMAECHLLPPDTDCLSRNNHDSVLICIL